MEPTVLTVAGFDVVGLAVRTTNAAEAKPATAKLAALWHRFAADTALKKIGGPPVGVVTDYDSDEQGEYTSVAGVVLPEGAAAPRGLRLVRVPTAKYLLFRAEGPVPDCVTAGWRTVWGYFKRAGAPQRAFQADVERYGDGFVELLISVISSDTSTDSTI
jgi:predicted transcriptional regulator YdeE